MPKFDYSNDVFQNFEPDDYENNLPDESVFEAAVLDPYARNLIQDLTVSQWKNFSKISRTDIITEAVKFGLPTFRASELPQMFKSANLVSTSEVDTAVAPVLGGLRAAISGELLTFDQALDQIGSRVPVVGPFVSLAVSLYRSIRSAVEGSGRDIHYVRAMSYDKGTDTQVTLDILERLKDPDWTSIFMPIAPASGGFEVKNVIAGSHKGLSFTTRDMGDGVGILPELAGMDIPRHVDLLPDFAGRAGLWQFIKATSRTPGPETMRGYATFTPSAVQGGMYAWQRVMQVGPAMFRIDAAKIANAWMDFFDRMIAWALEQEDPLRTNALYAASWGDPRTFGTSSQSPTKPWGTRADAGNKFWRTWSVDEYPAAAKVWPGSLGRIVSFALDQQYFPQLRPALRTLVCAYVDPDAPALLADPSLRDYHDEMRRKLLEHPDRIAVELDLIPDSEYRSAMYQAQLAAGGGDQFKAKEPPKPHRALPPVDGAPAFEPGNPPPDYPGPTGTGAAAHGGGAAMLLAAGLGAALFLL